MDFKIQRRDRNGYLKKDKTKQSKKTNKQNENNRFNKQNNNFARASHFFVQFFAVFARLRRENA